jgi:hypothetical protein
LTPARSVSRCPSRVRRWAADSSRGSARCRSEVVVPRRAPRRWPPAAAPRRS